MRPTRSLQLLLGFVLFAGAQVRAQGKSIHYQFRVWQFLPDSSHTSPGTLSGVAGEDQDFHLFIALGSGAAPLAPDVRLDGDFAVHQMRDSTIFVGDITATRVLSRDSTTLFARDLRSEDRLERRTYRLRATTNRGGPVWFYPFGVPRRGERGIAFEFTASDTEPADTMRRIGTRFTPPTGFTPMEYGINGLKRPHRAHVRLEVGDRTFQTVFEDAALTRVPVRIPLKGGARGQDLMFELAAQETPGETCWRWYWADEGPPGGFGCGPLVTGKAVEQNLGGSARLRMRVTVSSPN